MDNGHGLGTHAAGNGAGTVYQRVDTEQDLGRLADLAGYPEGGHAPELQACPEGGQSTLSIAAAAAALRLSAKTVRRMIQRGELPATQAKEPGGQRQYRIPRAAVDSLASRDTLDRVPRVDSSGGETCPGPRVDTGETAGRQPAPGEGGQGTQGRPPESVHGITAVHGISDPERLAQLEADLAEARERVTETAAENARLHALASERAGEIEFLRARLVEAEKGSEQLRILLLRESEQVSALTAPAAALPAPRRPWWRWGRRL